MKMEDALPALRDGKSLYNSEFHQFITIKKVENTKFPDKIDLYLVDDCGIRSELWAELLLSEKWNVVE